MSSSIANTLPMITFDAVFSTTEGRIERIQISSPTAVVNLGLSLTSVTVIVTVILSSILSAGWSIFCMSGTGVIFAIGDGDYLPYIQIQAMGFIVQVPTFCCQLAGIRINGKIGRSLLSKSKVKSSPASSSVARNTSPMFSPLPLCSHPLCEWCGARLPH